MKSSITHLNLIFNILKEELYKNRIILFKNIDDTNRYIQNINKIHNELNRQLLMEQISNREIKYFLETRIKPIVSILKELNPDSIINNSHNYRYILDTLIEDSSVKENSISDLTI